MTFPVHSFDSAPDAAKPTLAAVKSAYGFIPNLLGVMANAPALAAAYLAMSKKFDQTSLTPAERQTVLLAASFENTCAYCMAAHSASAPMQKLVPDAVEALRSGQPIHDPRLEALRRFTRVVVTSRGWPSEADLDAFRRAGFTDQQALEVVLGVGLKTLSNYTNHIAGTPLDAAFSAFAWTKPA